MSDRLDYYAVLGVEPDASADDIKRAYRRLARQCHPDVNNGDADCEEQFKRLQEAYQVLSDPAKRAAYDRGGLGGEALFDTPVQGPFGDLFDLVDAMFGAGFAGRARQATGRGPARGRDLGAQVEIDLLDVLHGVTREVAYQRVVPCPECDGEGAAAGSSRQRCATCEGHGRVQYVQNSLFGQMSTVTECPDCRGRGYTIPDPCKRCRGLGFIQEEQRVEAEVPPGVDDGATLRVAGYGDFPPDPRGQPGDLMLTVRVKPHPDFQRQGDDLLGEVAVNAAEAALGTKREVEGLDEQVKIEIKPGTQPGDEVVARGKGLPTRRGSRRGSLRFRVKVVVPAAHGRREHEILDELSKLWADRKR